MTGDPARSILDRARRWARAVKRDLVALWLAGRDPRTPWYAKAVVVAVVAYALSPIDLIPDFVPVVGYLDDLVIVPLGILLAVRLVPPGLMAEFRRAAADVSVPPAQWAGAVAVVLLWAAGVAALGWWLAGRYL